MSWSSHRNTDGKPYWYNKVTKKSSWTRPEGDDVPDPPPIVSGPDNDSCWTEHKTEKGVPYYHNTKTGVTVWEKPKGFTSNKDGAPSASAASDAVQTSGAKGPVNVLDEVESVLTSATKPRTDSSSSSSNSSSSVSGNKSFSMKLSSSSQQQQQQPKAAAAQTSSTSSMSRHSLKRQVSVDQFKQMLMEHGIPSTATFESAATPAVVNDARWAALSSNTERRAAFSKFLEEQRVRERAQFEERKRTQKDRCLQVLRQQAEAADKEKDGSAGEKTADAARNSDDAQDDDISLSGAETAEERFAELGWGQVRTLLADDPTFGEVSSEDEAEFYFEEFQRRARKAARDRKASRTAARRQELQQFLRSRPEFGPDAQWRKLAKLVNEQPRLAVLPEMEQLRAFEAEQRAAQAKVRAEVQEARDQERRQGRERRDAFRALLRELAAVDREPDGPLLTRRSRWAQFSALPEVASDQRFVDMQGLPGSHPAELFDDVVDEVYAELRRRRKPVRALCEAVSFPVHQRSFDELRDLVRGSGPVGDVDAARVNKLRAECTDSDVVLRHVFDNERTDHRFKQRETLLQKLDAAANTDGKKKGKPPVSVDQLLAAERESLVGSESPVERRDNELGARAAIDQFYAAAPASGSATAAAAGSSSNSSSRKRSRSQSPSSKKKHKKHRASRSPSPSPSTRRSRSRSRSRSPKKSKKYHKKDRKSRKKDQDEPEEEGEI